MKIKLIDFGLKEKHYPFRPHENDAGADVFMPYDCTLHQVRLPEFCWIRSHHPGWICRICLSTKQSMAAKGLVCELPPIDSGYRGEIHAILSNVSTETQIIHKDITPRVGQLVITTRFNRRFCSGS